MPAVPSVIRSTLPSFSMADRTVFSLLLAAVLTVGLISEASAQSFQFLWLDVGDYQRNYSSAGAQGQFDNQGERHWRMINDLSDAHVDGALWIGTKNWIDENGETHDYFVTLTGPRNNGVGYSFPVEHELVSSLGEADNPEDSQPAVFVRGGNTFDVLAPVDRVDPEMGADRMVHTVTNTAIGVTMERKAYAFSQQFHDDYHIIEYVYTNTGNVDDDAEIELPEQTLTDLYIHRSENFRTNEKGARVVGAAQTWGKWNMIDVVGDGHQDYEVDLRATYTWAGFNPNFNMPFSNLGSSVWNDEPWYILEGDTVGRLAGGDMNGRAVIFGEKVGNEAPYDIDSDFPPPPEMDADDLTSRDPTEHQPHVLGYQDADGRLTSIGEPMRDYYEIGILSDGSKQGTYPHYADIIEPDGNFATTTNDAANGRQGGYRSNESFGPYELEPGESVRIVMIDGSSGLTWHAQTEIGKAFKRSNGEDSLQIAYDANGDGIIQGTENDVPGDGVSPAIEYDESLTKNQWALTARDSLNMVFRRAIANYRSGFAIPQPPLPPREVRVDGRPDRIEVRWDAYDGGPERTAWEVYRTDRHVSNRPYTLIATLPPEATSYDDQDVTRGLDYYYTVRAVGEVNQDDTGLTPTGVRLRSSRYYAQTYAPASLKRPPGEQISDTRIVPNPFNLSAEESLRWPGGSERLAFLNIPGQSRIQIFTETGELVETIEHTDGSGDEFWNLTTEARQIVVSGIYVAIIEDLESGQMIKRKFTIIR